MNLRIAAAAVGLAAMTFVSCSKDKDDKSNPITEETSKYFVRLSQGTGENDTVHLITYDSLHRVTKVVDSTHADTYTTVYNEAGQATIVTESYVDEYFGETVTYDYYFSYDASNRLVQAEDEESVVSQRFTFEYATDGTLSKKTHYTKSSRNVYQVWRTFSYTVSGGNITNIKEYDAAGTLVSETVYTFTTDENVFKSLAYVNNFKNQMGLEELANMESLFNKNLIATSTMNGQVTTYSYKYNDNKQLVAVVSNAPDYIFTRTLGY